MEAEEKLEAKPKKRIRTRILKLALVIVVILILLLVFLLPAFVSSEKGRKTILAKINNSIDGRINFRRLSMSWFKGVIGLDKTLDMSITLTFTENALTARTGKEITGKRITLPLKGTVDKPELDMGKLLEEQLKQKLFEGLDKLFK